MHNLLAANALSGCDTVSSCAGIGKSSVLKKFAGYGNEIVLSDLSASLKDVAASFLKFVTALNRQSFPRTAAWNVKRHFYKKDSCQIPFTT